VSTSEVTAFAFQEAWA